MNRIIRLTLLVLTLVALNSAYVIPPVFAANVGGAPAGGANVGGQPASGGGLTNPLGSVNSLPDFLNLILEAVIQIGVIVLTLAIVYVGFLFVKAQGNEEQLRSARSALMWTVIGGLVLLGAQTIGLVIESTVNSLK
jgi:hypothetical protein